MSCDNCNCGNSGKCTKMQIDLTTAGDSSMSFCMAPVSADTCDKCANGGGCSCGKYRELNCDKCAQTGVCSCGKARTVSTDTCDKCANGGTCTCGKY